MLFLRRSIAPPMAECYVEGLDNVLLRARGPGAGVRADWSPRLAYSMVDTTQDELLSSNLTRKGFQPRSRIFIEMSAGCSASDANKSDLIICPLVSTRMGHRRCLVCIAQLPTANWSRFRAQPISGPVWVGMWEPGLANQFNRLGTCSLDRGKKAERSAHDCRDLILVGFHGPNGRWKMLYALP